MDSDNTLPGKIMQPQKRSPLWLPRGHLSGPLTTAFDQKRKTHIKGRNVCAAGNTGIMCDVMGTDKASYTARVLSNNPLCCKCRGIIMLIFGAERYSALKLRPGSRLDLFCIHQFHPEEMYVKTKHAALSGLMRSSAHTSALYLTSCQCVLHYRTARKHCVFSANKMWRSGLVLFQRKVGYGRWRCHRYRRGCSDPCESALFFL